jgi:hypothetical protein
MIITYTLLIIKDTYVLNVLCTHATFLLFIGLISIYILYSFLKGVSNDIVHQVHTYSL